MTSSTHSQGTYTWYFLIFQNLCHLAKTNPGCLTQQIDSLVPPLTTVHNPNHHRCMERLSTHQHMGALLITPHPLINSHILLLYLHPPVDHHRHLPYINLLQTPVVLHPHQLIVLVKALCLPMYLMERHHHRISISLSGSSTTHGSPPSSYGGKFCSTLCCSTIPKF